MGVALQIFGLVVIAYFLALNGLYLLFTGIAWARLTEYVRFDAHSIAGTAFLSPLTPPISVLLPAFNEQASIIESVRSLLALRYPEHEVIVINDGSTDETLARLLVAFDLVPLRKVIRDDVPAPPLKATYVSRRHPNLFVLDKMNGGKAEALNCGLNAARYPYICAVDADAVIEDDALLRVAQPILERPDAVAATGGIVRIANGCRLDHGRVVEIGVPSNVLAGLQAVEYLRAFLIGRVAWSSLNSLLIISGAFGLFRRSLVIEAGGYSRDTVGEDVELVVRLHRRLRERGENYRITFVPDPVCWTEAPEDLATLSRQRRRWQRGLGEALWRNRSAIGNPRYGLMGLLALPYFLVFEFIGPLIELAGYIGLPIAVLSHTLAPRFLFTFLVVAVAVGILLSVSALALEELTFRRHERWGDLVRLVALATFENLGFPQLTALWRVIAFRDLARRHRDWGVMRRRGFSPSGSS
jgi:cellulose synthase/poly-beta-1,6-N-acetylglucosamine synthase-like glycosyltransferase